MGKPLVLAAIAAALLAACSTAPSGAPAPVDAVASPALPAWIASISPTRRAQSLSQIRIIFAKPVATLGVLEGVDSSDLLSHFAIAPALRGAFVLLTPRMVAFVPEQPLPVGNRVRVTLSKGLHDLAGDALAEDLRWTFESPPLTFSNLPQRVDRYGGVAAPADIAPTITIDANAAVDVASLGARVELIGRGQTVAVGVTAVATPGPSTSWRYTLAPRSTLSKDTVYELRIEPGVRARDGNLTTTNALIGSIRTYAALAVVPTPVPSPSDAAGRFANGDPVVRFNNPLDPKSVAANVTIAPAANGTSLTSTQSYDPAVVNLNPYLLDPDTNYTLTLGAGLTDVFGQRLGHAVQIPIRTGDFAAGFWAPSGTNIFPSGTAIALDAYATNISGNRYRFYLGAVSPQSLARNGDFPLDRFPAVSSWATRTIPNVKRNAQSILSFPLQTLLGGSTGTRAYGLAAEVGDGSTWFTGMLQLTDLGVFAQIFPTHALVLVQRLSDGSAVAGARVDVYRAGSDVAAGICASGTTDAGGEFDLTGAGLASCYAQRLLGDSPSIMVVARRGADWSSATIGPWGGLYQYAIDDSSWTDGAPLSRGTIFSDRQMYQPGERARLTGIAYLVRDGVVRADAHARYTLTMSDPKGRPTALGGMTTDAYGVFSFPVTFAPSQMLGYYTFQAVGENGNRFSGSVRVAEFKPPNFKLDVVLDKSSAVAGTAVNASASAAYLFGAPLDGGTATITVTRDIAYLAPTGWDQYAFGRQWFWPEEQPQFQSDVLQQRARFDSAGKLAQRVDVPSTLAFPMTYTIDVRASDISNLTVDNTQTFTALGADATIGLKTDLIGQAGAPLNVSTIVTTIGGKAVAGRAIHLDLQKMTYAAATQVVDGGDQPQNAVSYSTVDSVDVTSGSSAVVAVLHPRDPGPYRIRANFAGSTTGASETDLQAFVAGAGQVDWGGQDTTIAQVRLDKKTYRVGDRATALVTSPYAKSDVYFAVVRQDVLSKTLVHATGSAVKFSFTVTPAMLPNVALEALVVRRGPPLRTLKRGALDSLARVGVAALHVDLGDRYLRVALTPQHRTLQPGASQSIAVQLRDARGRPMRGEAIVMVVNEAILQLTGYRPPDLVQTVFADQPISTRFADNRGSVVLAAATPPSEKGWGYGGGYLGGAGSTRVRTKFQPLAYYAVVQTDANGRVKAAFTLPDDLTTWRAMAVAIGSDDAHFGNADTTFIATKPLLTNPLLPQFARPGDRIDGGVSLLDTAQGGTAGVIARLTGALTFATGDPREARASSPVGAQLSALRFPMIVGTPAPTTVSFASSLGSAGDAFRVPFEVRDREVTESSIDTGVATGTVAIPIDLSRGGTLSVTLSNSALAGAGILFARGLSDDPLPFVDDAAARVTIATSLTQLKRFGMAVDASPIAQRSDALATIAKAQRDDGGYGYIAGADASDPYETAAAVDALTYAAGHGAAIDAQALARAKGYAARVLANPGSYVWCKTDACRARLRFEMLWTLDALGDRRSDFLSDIVTARATFDESTQIRLARFLLRVPGWKAQGVAQADSLEQALYRTGRYATQTSDARWNWLGSTVDAQTQMLDLLLERNADAQTVDGAVAALLAQRCRCGWPTPDDTAAASRALADYAGRERLTPSAAVLSAGAKQLLTQRFAATPASHTISLSAARLNDARNLTLRASGGKIHYMLLYTYPVAPDAPGQLAGLRVVRAVRSAGETSVLATMDLTSLRAPVALDAGNTFVVDVRLIVDHPIDGVIIEDPLPAGMEAVDASLPTSGFSDWRIDDSEMYADRVMFYASHLEPGVVDISYLARTVTPGTYRWPGARAYLRAAPEQLGRTASTTVTIR